MRSSKTSYVIYTAHWDHFGIGPEVNGDRIYHGAVDNASGTAAPAGNRASLQTAQNARRGEAFSSSP